MLKHRPLFTRRSAIEEIPRDALCQMKSYKLWQNCTRNRTRKGLQSVNDLEGHSMSSSKMALHDSSHLVIYYKSKN